MAKNKITKIQCTGKCKEIKPKKEFFKSNKVEYEDYDSYCTVCKQCLRELNYSNNQINIEGIKLSLEFLDKPFLWEVYYNVAKSKWDLGTYLRQLNTSQYKKLTFKNSDKDEVKDEKNQDVNIVEKQEAKKNSLNETEYDFNYLEDKYGMGYSKEEYIAFEKKWNKLIDNYGEKTSFHIEALITYIRFRVKEELATANGNVKEAKDWGVLAKDAATAAKINVSQLSKSDISGGVDLLPQLFEAVESEVGIISIIPKLKEQPYDDADLIVWCVVNYIRRLEDKQRIHYRDIWNFYDKMLEEHFQQKGYSEEQVLKEKEKRNNIFRDLENVYKEPLYEESDI